MGHDPWDGIAEANRLQRTCRGVAFNPDGTQLATSSTEGTAKISHIKTGELLFTLTGHASGVVDIAYSPDGKKIAKASSDATAKIWDAATGKEFLTLTGQVQNLDLSRLARMENFWQQVVVI